MAVMFQFLGCWNSHTTIPLNISFDNPKIFAIYSFNGILILQNSTFGIPK
jgi:hypothetical protein